MLLIDNKLYNCTLEYGMDFIKGKWKTVIICRLNDRPQRFCELQKTMGNVSQKVFTESLREMEQDGLIKRIVYPEIPPKVEYALTKNGEKLMSALKLLQEWADDYIQDSQKEVKVVQNGA